MKISIIAAIGKNNELGLGGKLPWSLPNDLKRFKEITRGHTVIMGRKTYEAIGRLLPERENIIITRNKDLKVTGAVIASGIEDAIKQCEYKDEIFIIGGAEIYEKALPLADTVYLTKVDGQFEADAYFPAFDETKWQKNKEETHKQDNFHEHAFTFLEYKRK